EADGAGEARQRSLPLWREQPLRPEPRLQLLEGELEGAETARLEAVEIELEGAARRVHAHAAAGDHLHPVRGPELQDLRRRPEHHGGDLALIVLERQVDVAGGLGAEIRDLARDPDPADTALEPLADERRELGHRPDAPRP